MKLRVRQRILQFISGHAGAEATQIARALGSTSPAVRHHLAILRADGRIVAVATPHGGHRGRPRLAYRISEALAGNNLAMLAEHLMAAWSADDSRPLRGQTLVPALTRQLSAELEPDPPGSSGTRRLGALVDRLNELHYASRWEAGSEGPRLIFGHCPYAAVVDQHPELCKVDAQSIAAITHAGVQQKAKIDLSGQGATSCVFSLKYR